MIKEIVRKNMVEAMKNKDKKTKDAYSYLLDQLQKAEKNMQSAKNPNPVLSEADEVAVVKAVVKQIKASIDKTVAEAEKKSLKMDDVNKFVAEREFEIKLYSEFLPEEMTAEQIQAIIEEIANGLPAPVNKGMLMKNTMIKVKGKADGKLVSTMVDEYLKK